MERIKVTIEGTTPLLMNKFSDAAAIQAASGTSPVMAGNRRRLKTGETSRSIGAAFGVARSTIRNIKAGYSWSWLDREERAAANLARQGA